MIEEFILEILSNWTVSFSHTFEINLNSKVLKCNCSSIFNHYFEQHFFSVYNKWKALNNKSLKAKDYFFVMESGLHFKKIETIDFLKKYDFMCWKKMNPPKNGDTGHVVCVLDWKIISDDKVVITVFDCTKTPHSSDERSQACGVGEMILIVQNKIPIGYQWSNLVKKNKLTKIVMARFCP